MLPFENVQKRRSEGPGDEVDATRSWRAKSCGGGGGGEEGTFTPWILDPRDFSLTNEREAKRRNTREAKYARYARGDTRETRESLMLVRERENFLSLQPCWSIYTTEIWRINFVV